MRIAIGGRGGGAAGDVRAATLARSCFVLLLFAPAFSPGGIGFAWQAPMIDDEKNIFSEDQNKEGTMTMRNH